MDIYFPFFFWIQAATCIPQEIGTSNEPMIYSGLTEVCDNWWKIFDSWTQYVPATRATRDNGPNNAEGTFSPTPSTDDGGASLSQYVGPGLADPILSDCMLDTPT